MERRSIIDRTISLPQVDLHSLHPHLSSPIAETEPDLQGLGIVLKFAVDMDSKFSFEMQELNPSREFIRLTRV